MIQLKRAYDDASASDGYRVLVDRLWPRGVKKEAAHIDVWLKELAPSTELRRWFGHDPERFSEFERRYERELRAPEARALLDALAERAASGTVTLVYAAQDEEHNNAVVIAHEVARRLGARGRSRAEARATARTTKAKATARATARATKAKKATARATPARGATPRRAPSKRRHDGEA